MLRLSPLAAFAVVAASLGSAAHAQTVDSPIDLEFGDYAVGFEVRRTVDRSRVEVADGADAPAPRPMEIAAWYPAAPGEGAEPLDYGDYWRETLRRGETWPAFLARYSSAFAGVDPDLASEMLATATRAFRDAPAADGRFPLVLYAPSFNAESFENTVLCEFLASHGYFVVACPSRGANSGPMTSDSPGVEAQLQDLRFLTSEFEDHPAVDATRIGTAGFSWGGLTNLVFAVGEPRVAAVVALDGSIGYGVGTGAIADRPHVRPSALHAAFLHTASRSNPAANAPPLDTRYFDHAENTDRFLLRFPGLIHQHFSSDMIARSVHCQKLPGHPEADVIDESYGALCHYTLGLLDGYVRGDGLARDSLDLEPETAGFSAGLFSHEVRRSTSAAGSRTDGDESR